MLDRAVILCNLRTQGRIHIPRDQTFLYVLTSMKVTLDVTIWAAAFSLSYGHRKSKCTLYIGYKHGPLHIGAVGCQMKCGFFKTMCLLCHSSAPTSAFVKEMRRYRREYIGCINTFRLGQNRNTNSYGQCVIFTNIFSIPLFTNLKL